MADEVLQHRERHALEVIGEVYCIGQLGTCSKRSDLCEATVNEQFGAIHEGALVGCQE